MSTTTNLGLPFIEGAQAQKHVTHNESLRILDTLVQLAVLDRDLATPPGSPSEGQRWMAASPTDAWAGHATHVASWQDAAWQFSVPATGWSAFVVDEGTLLTWNGTAWGDFFSTVTSLQNLAQLGVGTTADATNPFSAKLNNTLWIAKTVAEGGDGHLRYKFSKENAAKTLSLLFQTNFSGRAEVGLTGDDDLHFKVSPDGSSWAETLLLKAASGQSQFPQTTDSTSSSTGAVIFSGGVGIAKKLFTGDAISVPLGAVGSPTFSFAGDSNTGMWSPAADTLAWSTGGAERLRLTAAGLSVPGILALGGGSGALIAIDKTLAGTGYFRWDSGGVFKGALGLALGANDGASGTASGDMFFRSASNLIVQGGNTTGLILTSTNVNNPLTTASTTATTGALTVAGGLGVAGMINSNASARVHAGTAIPTGGTVAAGLLVSSTANFGVFFGSGAPTLSAAKGSIYLRSDGSTTNDRAYINTNGSTTWTALTTAA